MTKLSPAARYMVSQTEAGWEPAEIDAALQRQGLSRAVIDDAVLEATNYSDARARR